MAIKNRAILKNFFLKGSIPKSTDFHDLVDSMINQEDDGIVKKQHEALRISAEGKNEELLNFFKNIDDLEPTWKISQLTSEGEEGFNISEADGNSRFFIEKGGNVGIGTTRPKSKLEINGFVGMVGRIGCFIQDNCPANGEWHDVVAGLNHYSAFEIMAVTGRKGAHAVSHAIAVSAYGNSKGQITKTQAFFGRPRNKIDFRWSGSYFDYKLQIKTKRNYGDGVYIKFNVTKLF